MESTSTSELALEPGAIVEQFFAALQHGDTAAAAALMDDGIVWRNTTLPTVRGSRTVRRVLDLLPRARLTFAADIHHVAVGADGVVLTERTDYLSAGPVTVKFWVCGTFMLRDNKITVWSDRFSWENVLRGAIVGVLKAPFQR